MCNSWFGSHFKRYTNKIAYAYNFKGGMRKLHITYIRNHHKSEVLFTEYSKKDKRSKMIVQHRDMTCGNLIILC
jgi:thiamine kinase-like enzyme